MEKKTSETAVGVAALRAVHQLIDGDPKLLDDPIIVRMLDEATHAQILGHPEAYQTARLKALRAQVLIRSRYAEDQLAAAVARGVSQLVILGAGMDTFAYRQPAWASGLQIFELDHPASQSAKRRKLEAAAVPIPPNLAYLKVDFEKESIRSKLERSPFDFNQATFFSCLGVLMYLTEAAADSVLRFAASTPQQGELVFTFANQETAGTSVTERNAARKGEPWLTKYRPESLEKKLRDFGFSEIQFLTPEMINEMYIRDRKDGLTGPRLANIVSAKV